MKRQGSSSSTMTQWQQELTIIDQSGLVFPPLVPRTLHPRITSLKIRETIDEKSKQEKFFNFIMRNNHIEELVCNLASLDDHAGGFALDDTVSFNQLSLRNLTVFFQGDGKDKDTDSTTSFQITTTNHNRNREKYLKQREREEKHGAVDSDMRFRNTCQAIGHIVQQSPHLVKLCLANFEDGARKQDVLAHVTLGEGVVLDHLELKSGFDPDSAIEFINRGQRVRHLKLTCYHDSEATKKLLKRIDLSSLESLDVSPHVIPFRTLFMRLFANHGPKCLKLRCANTRITQKHLEMIAFSLAFHNERIHRLELEQDDVRLSAMGLAALITRTTNLQTFSLIQHGKQKHVVDTYFENMIHQYKDTIIKILVHKKTTRVPNVELYSWLSKSQRGFPSHTYIRDEKNEALLNRLVIGPITMFRGSNNLPDGIWANILGGIDSLDLLFYLLKEQPRLIPKNC